MGGHPEGFEELAVEMRRAHAQRARKLNQRRVAPEMGIDEAQRRLEPQLLRDGSVSSTSARSPSSTWAKVSMSRACSLSSCARVGVGGVRGKARHSLAPALPIRLGPAPDAANGAQPQIEQQRIRC